MTQFLSALECKLSIDEIEKLLVLRNALPGTVLYQAHFYPSWLTNSTISFLITGEYAEVALHIWSTSVIIDVDVARNLTFKSPESNGVDPVRFQEMFGQVMDHLSTVDWSNRPLREPQFEEERVVIPLKLANYYDQKMRNIGAIDLVSPEGKIGLDGMSVAADVLVLNERKNHFKDWHPTDNHLQYFWNLCFLALRCMEEHRSLKYLVALATWF